MNRFQTWLSILTCAATWRDWSTMHRVGRCKLNPVLKAPSFSAQLPYDEPVQSVALNRPVSVYRSARRALTLCPQLCVGNQPGARFPAQSADALPATLYGHFTQAIYGNRPIATCDTTARSDRRGRAVTIPVVVLCSREHVHWTAHKDVHRAFGVISEAPSCDLSPHGGVVQVDPMKPMLKPPRSKRSKRRCVEPLSDFAFKFHCAATTWALLALSTSRICWFPMAGRCSLTLSNTR